MRKEKVLEHKTGELFYIIGVEKNLTKHKQQKPPKNWFKKLLKLNFIILKDRISKVKRKATNKKNIFILQGNLIW